MNVSHWFMSELAAHSLSTLLCVSFSSIIAGSVAGQLITNSQITIVTKYLENRVLRTVKWDEMILFFCSLRLIRKEERQTTGSTCYDRLKRYRCRSTETCRWKVGVFRLRSGSRLACGPAAAAAAAQWGQHGLSASTSGPTHSQLWQLWHDTTLQTRLDSQLSCPVWSGLSTFIGEE